MGVRVISDGNGNAALFDSTSGFAFGPVFENWDDPEDFLEWFSEEGIGWAFETGRKPLPVPGCHGDDIRDWSANDQAMLVIRWREVREEEAGARSCAHPGCKRIAAQAGHGFCTDHQEDFWRRRADANARLNALHQGTVPLDISD